MTTTPRQFKDDIYDQLARLGKAVSAPKRLELLDLLCQGPRSVESLADQASISVANASQHLQVLRAAHLVEADKQGLYVIYRLAAPQVGEFFLSLRQLAEDRLAEVEHSARSYFAVHDGLEPIAADELAERMQRGLATVIDVRPIEEFRAGHLPGAVSVPLPELEARLAELPVGREVVAYCRGPFCVMSAKAVQLLRNRGISARRLELGVLDWQARSKDARAEVAS
jgi:rhodanese-related sulfurtransferase/DNA-binding transcriptional ArsR family regulator